MPQTPLSLSFPFREQTFSYETEYFKHFIRELFYIKCLIVTIASTAHTTFLWHFDYPCEQHNKNFPINSTNETEQIMRQFTLVHKHAIPRDTHT
jgi:hypothetical protein